VAADLHPVSVWDWGSGRILGRYRVDVGGLLQAIGSQPFSRPEPLHWRLCCSHYLWRRVLEQRPGTSDLKSCEQ